VIERQIYPTCSIIKTPTSERDIYPGDKPIYQAENTYEFTLEDKATILTRLCNFSDLLYESPHEAQFWLIFNENKKLVHFGDAWPEAHSLDKGKNIPLRLALDMTIWTM